jgi:predicted RecA/RadA family phage recombinase
MEAIFRKEPGTLPVSVATGGTAIAAGEVVVVTGVKVVGICNTGIAAGASGTLTRKGVFECAAPAVHNAVAQGDRIWFDESENKIALAGGAGNLYFGTAHLAALENSTTVYVDFDAEVCDMAALTAGAVTAHA